MSKNIYRITVSNWEKYNGKMKRGYDCIMLSTRFLDDAKVQALTIGGKLLYLGLLLRCGDERSSSVLCTHDVLVRLAGGSGVHIKRLLDRAQELQLLTVEINPSLNKVIERKEEKVSESEAFAPVRISSPSVIKSWEDLRDAVPLVTRERFAAWYPDKAWLDSQYERCFARATADPTTAPRTKGAWMKHLHTWLEVGWKTRGKVAPIAKQVKDFDLPPLPGGMA